MNPSMKDHHLPISPLSLRAGAVGGASHAFGGVRPWGPLGGNAEGGAFGVHGGCPLVMKKKRSIKWKATGKLHHLNMLLFKKKNVCKSE